MVIENIMGYYRLAKVGRRRGRERKENGYQNNRESSSNNY
jgi:hypothetical protein